MTISICIPAYKHTNFLKRLLDSILIQIFKDFEVIVTDDSPDDEVSKLCKAYQNQFSLHYFKNNKPLGTPENWNESIRKASGQWIKLMHDDDWFTSPESLTNFKKLIDDNPQASFFYSAYQNVFDKSKKVEQVVIKKFRKKKLEKNPATLFSSNVIGPPSVTLIRNEKKEWYDPKIKWLVDIDYYIRCLNISEPIFTDEVLINVGIHDAQVTRSAFRVGKVEIPESFYLFGKLGTHQLRDVLVYDAWWRLIRNLKIRSLHDISKNGYLGTIHPAIRSMIRVQSFIPIPMLQIGVFSKLLMFIHYIFHRSALK